MPVADPVARTVPSAEPIRGSLLFAPVRDEELAAHAILRGVPREAVEGRLLSCPVHELEPEQFLIREGEVRSDLYLVLSGLLEVRIGRDGDAVPIATIPAGQTVGELAVIDPRPSNASVVAIERSRVLVVDEGTFWAMVAASHQLAVNMLRLLAARTRLSTSRVGEVHEEMRSLEELARLDALTGLYNRRWLDETLPRLLHRASYDATPLTLVVVDVDHFKRVNDTWGHPTGDRVLVAVGAMLRRFLRPTDFAARFGGEEFVIVLPQTPREGGVVVAERIRAAVRDAKVEACTGERLPSITASFGVAAREPGEDAHALLHRADALLYEAKRSGRDRVCV